MIILDQSDHCEVANVGTQVTNFYWLDEQLDKWKGNTCVLIIDYKLM